MKYLYIMVVKYKYRKKKTCINEKMIIALRNIVNEWNYKKTNV